VTRSATLRDHVATAILDAAAVVFAEHGEAASMADVATTAGVGRTTLYRYFPSREVLQDALTQAVGEEWHRRFAEAGLDTAGAREGIARATRIIFGFAAKYEALAWALRKPEVPDETKRRLAEPIAALFRRGAADGAWRAGLSDETLLNTYLALVMGALHDKMHHRMGVEPAAAAITSVFLDGTAAR
jgi:AcrR family transcriptional regulator